MAAEPTIAVLSITSDRWRKRAVLLYAAMVDYWALTKPEVNFLIAIATFAGFCLARPTHVKCWLTPALLYNHFERGNNAYENRRTH
jgi:heme O synthase-like polyprenyltransferase